MNLGAMSCRREQRSSKPQLELANCGSVKLTYCQVNVVEPFGNNLLVLKVEKRIPLAGTLTAKYQAYLQILSMRLSQ